MYRSMIVQIGQLDDVSHTSPIQMKVIFKHEHIFTTPCSLENYHLRSNISIYMEKMYEEACFCKILLLMYGSMIAQIGQLVDVSHTPPIQMKVIFKREHIFYNTLVFRKLPFEIKY